MNKAFEWTNQSLFLVAVVGILALIYGVLDRYHPKLDLTENKIYTLSDKTLKVLKGLKKDIQAEAFIRPGTSEALRIEAALEEYSTKARHFKYKIYDLDRDLLMARRKDVKKPNTILLKAGDRSKTLQSEEIFSFGSIGGGREFTGEEALTSAIVELTEEKVKRVCFVSGHGEKRINDQSAQGASEFKEGLEKENYEVLDFPLMQKKKIKGECDGLVILGPSQNYLKEETDLVENYLKKGGRALIALDPLKYISFSFLKTYGITPSVGRIVLDPRNAIALRGPASIMPAIGSHPSVKVLQDVGAIYFFEAMPLEISTKKDITPTRLFHTSSQAYTKRVEKGARSISVRYDPKKDQKGEFTVGAAVEKGKTRLIVLADSDFLSNALIRDLLNRDAGINMVNWLLESEQKISIRPKSAERKVMTLEASQLKWMAWTIIVFTPLSMLIIAGWLFWRRRTL